VDLLVSNSRVRHLLFVDLAISKKCSRPLGACSGASSSFCFPSDHFAPPCHALPASADISLATQNAVNATERSRPLPSSPP